MFLEQVWNRDLSNYDPDGPLPEIGPDVSDSRLAQGRASNQDIKSRLETARLWREIADHDRLSIRQLAIRVTARQHFVGTPDDIADEINRHVQTDAADGFVFAPHLTLGGFDEFVEEVVPLLRERGVYRAEYREKTLRSTLGLPDQLSDTASPNVAAAMLTRGPC